MARLLLNFEAFREGIPDLYEAVLLEVKDFFPIVYHRHRAVRCSLDLITNAQRCAEAIERARHNPVPRPWEIDLRHAPEISGVVPNTDITNMLLSENANLLVATDALARYILFKNGLQAISPQVVRLMLKEVKESKDCFINEVCGPVNRCEKSCLLAYLHLISQMIRDLCNITCGNLRIKVRFVK